MRPKPAFTIGKLLRAGAALRLRRWVLDFKTCKRAQGGAKRKLHRALSKQSFSDENCDCGGEAR